MIPNNNFSILPFYESLDEQDYKKWFSFGKVFTLISHNKKVLPFQIVTELGVGIDTVGLVNKETGIGVDITAEMNSAGLRQDDFTDYSVAVFPSLLLFSTLVMESGQYYLSVVLNDFGTRLYSDVFTVVSDLTPYVKIEYYDRSDLIYNGGRIVYTTFKNYVYVQSEIGKPEYPFTEEAQNRDGFIFVEKQISEKKYKFEFLSPEYLCDALRIVRMHDYVTVNFKGVTYNVESIIFDPKWQEQGNLAIMEVEFELDTIVKKIGKGIGAAQGDYNADYNNDYNN